MTVNLKKRHLIITGLILFGIIFYVKHHNILGNPEIDVSFKLENLNSEISFDKTQIVLSRIEKPWYSMRMTMNIPEVSPNENGIVSFKLRKSKSYEVGIYTDKKETSCGGIYFDADTLSQNQTLIIPMNELKK